MHESIERPMTDAVRKRLLDYVPTMPSPFRERKFKLTAIAELGGILLAIVLLIGLKKTSTAFAISGAVIFLACWWLIHLKSRILTPLRRHRATNHRVSKFRQAVNSAKTVRVHCVESDEVVQVTHDEGTICLFDVGQNRTYWIDPYLMTPGHPPEDWPNRKFEVIEVPGWEEELGPFCLGKRLRPRETFEFRNLFEHYDFEPPADGLINQSLNAFLQDAQTRNRSGAKASTT